MTDSILQAALELVEEVGFDGVTVDRISERTGASRASIYRRWSNVSAIIMDAFMAEAGPSIPFERQENIVETFRSAMKHLIEILDGRFGKILSALLGRAQTNPQLLEAFWSGWIEKRRKIAHEFIREAISNGQLRPDTDGEILIDALYGAIYYRLLIAYAPLTDEYIDTVVDYVFNGVIGENLKKKRK
jgi:AcrR family transcriptional regulator